MKKMQLLYLFSDIKKTIVSFVSIALFVAFGISIFLGVRWNEPAMTKKVNQYLSEHNYHDFLLSFPYGFTNEDITAISKIDGISSAEGSYSAFGTSWIENKRYVLSVQAITDNIDTADILQGKRPENPDEIGIEKLFAEAAGLKIGDKISIDTSRNDVSNLTNNEFIITGIVAHPSYFSNGASYSRGLSDIGDGSVDFYAVAPKSAFNKTAYDNCFSQVLVRADKLNGLNSFGDDYQTKSRELADVIKNVGITYACRRNNSLEETAEKAIADAENLLADAQKELSDKKLAAQDGENKIEDLKRSVTEAENKIITLKKELQNGKDELLKGEKELSDFQSKLDNSLIQLNSARSELEKAKQALIDGQNQIEDAEQKIVSGEAELEKNKILLNNLKNEYAANTAEYNAKKSELELSLKKLQEELKKAGFSESLDTAKIQLLEKKSELTGPQDKNLKYLKQVTAALEFIEEYNTNIFAVDTDELAELLIEVFEQTGCKIEKEDLEKITNRLEKLKSRTEIYINNPDSLTAFQRNEMLILLKWLGLNQDTSGAQKLAERIDLANDLIDRYNEDYHLAVKQDLKVLVILMAINDTHPDFTALKCLLTVRQAVLECTISKSDAAISEIDFALENIAAYYEAQTLLENAQKQLLEADEQIKEFENELIKAENLIVTSKTQLENSKKELLESKILFNTKQKEFDEKSADFDIANSKLSASKQELFNSRKKIEQGDSLLAEKESMILSAKAEIKSAESILSQSKEQIASAEKALGEKQNELNDAKAKQSEFVRYNQWTVQKRTDNQSVASAKFYAESSNRLCFSMALLFVIVGLMVCYTSVVRNINESRVLTGIQKALGFKRREIILHYMLYSIFAVIIGSVLGCLWGYYIIESIINGAYMKRYSFGTINNVFVISDAALIIFAELIIIGLATYLPCRKHFKQSAINLLNKTEALNNRARFYERFKLWKKLSLYSKATVNNLLNDGSRIIATLVGVIGCCALIVATTGMQFSIHDTPQKHFSDIWLYDESVIVDNTVENATEKLSDVLQNEGIKFMPLLRESVFVETSDGDLSKADLMVINDNENTDDFIRIRNQKSKENIPLTQSGVVISRTYQKHNNIDIGDKITVMDIKGVYYDFPVIGVSEHYLSTIQITMGSEYYEETMGKPAKSNTLFINSADKNNPELLSRLKEVDGFFSLKDESQDWIKIFEDVTSTTMIVTYIGIFLAAVMALLVLLNLNIVSVNEKRDQIITMRINGFGLHAAKKYIYRDNVVLNVIGIAIGVFVGGGLGKWILNVVQKNGDNFYTAVNPKAIILGVAITALFSLITNIISLRRINKYTITDLNK